MEQMNGVSGMKESDAYQAIVEEGWIKGKLEGKKEIIFRQGKSRFGSPPPNIVKTIENTSDFEILDKWGDNVLLVRNWQELIDGV